MDKENVLQNRNGFIQGRLLILVSKHFPFYGKTYKHPSCKRSNTRQQSTFNGNSVCVFVRECEQIGHVRRRAPTVMIYQRFSCGFWASFFFPPIPWFVSGDSPSSCNTDRREQPPHAEKGVWSVEWCHCLERMSVLVVVGVRWFLWKEAACDSRCETQLQTKEREGDPLQEWRKMFRF